MYILLKRSSTIFLSSTVSELLRKMCFSNNEVFKKCVIQSTKNKKMLYKTECFQPKKRSIISEKRLGKIDN